MARGKRARATSSSASSASASAASGMSLRPRRGKGKDSEGGRVREGKRRRVDELVAQEGIGLGGESEDGTAGGHNDGDGDTGAPPALGRGLFRPKRKARVSRRDEEEEDEDLEAEEPGVGGVDGPPRGRGSASMRGGTGSSEAGPSKSTKYRRNSLFIEDDELEDASVRGGAGVSIVGPSNSRKYRRNSLFIEDDEDAPVPGGTGTSDAGSSKSTKYRRNSLFIEDDSDEAGALPSLGGAGPTRRKPFPPPSWRRVRQSGGLYVEDNDEDLKAEEDEEADSKKNLSRQSVDLIMRPSSSRTKKNPEIETVDLTFSTSDNDQVDSSPDMTPLPTKPPTSAHRERRPSWALDKNDPIKEDPSQPKSSRDGKRPMRTATDHPAPPRRNSPTMAATMRQKPLKPPKPSDRVQAGRRTTLSPDGDFNNEDDLLNAAGNQLLANSMPAFNTGDVDWMDGTVYARSTAEGGAMYARRRTGADGVAVDVPLTREELQEMIDGMENRPGHVRRRLVSRRELSGEAGVRVSGAATGDADVEVQVGDEAEEEEAEVDIVEFEKQQIVEAATRLGLRRKRKLVTRREEIADEEEPAAAEGAEVPVAALRIEAGVIKAEAAVKAEPGNIGDAGVSGNVVAADGVVIKPERKEMIVVAVGPDGRPRRYRRIDEIKTFYRVSGMTTALLDHQILGVDWMLNDREWSDTGPKGGILADQMGLGKTMQAIATMVLNPPPPYQRAHGPRTTLIVAPTALLPQWAEEIQRHTREGTFEVFVNHGGNKFKNAADLESKDVVITSYASVMRSHPNPKRPRRKMSDKEVEEWWDDVWENERKDFHRVRFWRVILDESHVIKNPRSRTSMACTSLITTHMWAISGTPIQNTLLDMYPIFRFLNHRFSDLQIFHHVFGTNASNATARGAKAMQAALAGLMMRRNKEQMLCGRKLLDLTPKEVRVVKVGFSGEERALYRVVERKSIERVNELHRRMRDEGTFYMQTLVLLLRLRQICDHPYLIMDAITKDFTIGDLKSALEDEKTLLAEIPPADDDTDDSDDDLPENPFSLAARRPEPPRPAPAAPAAQGLRRVLQLAQHQAIGDTTQCSICLDLPEDPVMTGCRHVFCQGCIMAVIQRAAMNGGNNGNAEDEEGGSRCPLCQRPISEDELRVHSPNAQGGREEEGGGTAHWVEGVKHLMPSAKMKALVEQVRTWREERPEDKIIIFSQFVKMLDLIQLTLDDEGWESTMYTGATSLKVREASLKRFRRDPDCMIMLISLRAGGVGLNLTDANLVISVDMWWNAAVEHQAFDRVHRLGQTKTVEVVRFMVGESVEGRIGELQKRKLVVADAAMGEGLGRVRGLTRRELMGLFGKVVQGEDGIDMVVQDD